MCRLALFLGIAACVGFSATEGVHISNFRGSGPVACAGCVSPFDPNDPVLMNGLKAAFADAGENIKPIRITEAWSQVVAGVKYIVDFDTEDNRKCHASWVDQPWVTKKPQYFRFTCSNPQWI